MKYPTKCVSCGKTSNVAPGYLRVLRYLKDNGVRGLHKSFGAAEIAKGMKLTRQRGHTLIKLGVSAGCIGWHDSDGHNPTYHLTKEGRDLLRAWNKPEGK